MNSTETNELVNLAKFITIIISHFKDLKKCKTSIQLKNKRETQLPLYYVCLIMAQL